MLATNQLSSQSSPVSPSACLDLVYCLLQIMFRCSVTHLGTGCSVHFLLCVSQGSRWIRVGIISSLLIQKEKKPPRIELLPSAMPLILAGYVLQSCVNVLSEQAFRQWSCGATVLRGGRRARWPHQQPWKPSKAWQVLAPVGESLASVLGLPLPHKLN